jgi:predicted component of type VI protein secretion system
MPDLENILNKLNNESAFEKLLKDLIKENSTLEEVINLSILINIYEKISIDLSENINKLTK